MAEKSKAARDGYRCHQVHSIEWGSQSKWVIPILRDYFKGIKIKKKNIYNEGKIKMGEVCIEDYILKMA